MRVRDIEHHIVHTLRVALSPQLDDRIRSGDEFESHGRPSNFAIAVRLAVRSAAEVTSVAIG